MGGKSGKMGSIRMGVYTGMGRRQNRWIPIQHHHGLSPPEQRDDRAAPPAAVSGYEPIFRNSAHPPQSPPATFHLRPDQPASFCFTGSMADQYHHRHHSPPSPYIRPEDGGHHRPAAEGLHRPCRGGSVEPPRNCDDIVKQPVRLGGSVPSSPSGGGGSSASSRLWGSFRAAGGANSKKAPLMEKRQCSPHVKTAS